MPALGSDRVLSVPTYGETGVSQKVNIGVKPQRTADRKGPENLEGQTLVGKGFSHQIRCLRHYRD